MRLAHDYQYESEEEREQQTSKKPDKTELPKKPTKKWFEKLNEWINKKETGIDRELFKKHFNVQRPSDMLYNTNDKKKSNDLVIMNKSGLNELKREAENMSEEEKEIEKPNEIIDIVEKILEFND